MMATQSTVRRTVRTLLALLVFALLALPATAGHAAPAGAGAAGAQVVSSPFEARVTQGPDHGAYLAGTLQLTLVGQRTLIGRLLVQPVPQQRSLTTMKSVPVTALVLPAQQAVLLSFATGGAPLRVLVTTSHTASPEMGVPASSPATHGSTLGGGQVLPTGQAGGPHSGDVLQTIVIHIHIEGKGWSVDITIEI
jgi:hypothetical protein